MIWLHLQSAFGLAVLVVIAWALSEDCRAALNGRLILSALALQLSIALLLLEVPVARSALFSLNTVVDALTKATQTGTSFVFGYVGGGAPPFAVTSPNNAYSLAFQALPLILVMSALSALLWHWRVLPVIVKGFAWVLQKTLSIGGAVGLGSAATVFLGMIEAPLLIRPYLAKLARAELFMLFTVGLSTVAGTVMVLYATVLEPVVPGALGHILVASMISLPSALLTARLMVPGASTTPAEAHEAVAYRSSMDAIAKGTEDGMRLYLGIIAMLYAMCGFANFGSVGIMIAGVSGMIPERRHEVVELALKALVSGTIASGMTGCIVGMLPSV